MDSGKGMSGGGHIQLWPQHGEFSITVGGKTMVSCRSIRATKQCVSRASRGAGDESSAKGIRDDPDGLPGCVDRRPT